MHQNVEEGDRKLHYLLYGAVVPQSEVSVLPGGCWGGTPWEQGCSRGSPANRPGNMGGCCWDPQQHQMMQNPNQFEHFNPHFILGQLNDKLSVYHLTSLISRFVLWNVNIYVYLFVCVFKQQQDPSVRGRLCNCESVALAYLIQM